ncbi:hypothetical protein TNCV_2523881 [Trichonephila clavipes]|nr:hypothetical protein TNCV_2523881 [Trichonephila clavipes]
MSPPVSIVALGWHETFLSALKTLLVGNLKILFCSYMIVLWHTLWHGGWRTSPETHKRWGRQESRPESKHNGGVEKRVKGDKKSYKRALGTFLGDVKGRVWIKRTGTRVM